MGFIKLITNTSLLNQQCWCVIIVISSADVLSLGLPQLDAVDWGTTGIVCSTGTYGDHKANGVLTGARYWCLCDIV